MEDKLICIYVPAEGKPRFYAIENTLKAMQEAVGGLIQAVGFAEDCCIICNEEGRLLGMPPNRAMGFFGNFVGDCLLVGVDGEDFCSLSPGQYEILQRSMNSYLSKQRSNANEY